jgi:hypothetical protein
MARTKVHTLMNEIVGKSDYEQREHIQTVKITESSHAKLRALADLANRTKTALLADLVMAAIDDAIDALPNEPLEEAAADKLRGITAKAGIDLFGPRGVRDCVIDRAEFYLSIDERWGKEDAAVPADVSSSNGEVH